MRRNAIKSALAQKLRDGKIVCLDGFDLGSPKTKELEGALAGKLGVTAKALLLPLDVEANLDLAARNNPRLKVVRALGVSIVDLLDHDTIVVSEPALKRPQRGVGVMKLTMHDIIRQPLVTEKSHARPGDRRRYCFKADAGPTKCRSPKRWASCSA
jgi:hypothetical protein